MTNEEIETRTRPGDDWELPRIRWYDRTGEPHDDVIRTKSGKVLTEEDILRYAEQAEAAGEEDQP